MADKQKGIGAQGKQTKLGQDRSANTTRPTANNLLNQLRESNASEKITRNTASFNR